MSCLLPLLPLSLPPLAELHGDIYSAADWYQSLSALGERKGWYGHALNYPCPSEHLLAEQPGWGVSVTWKETSQPLHERT